MKWLLGKKKKVQEYLGKYQEIARRLEEQQQLENKRKAELDEWKNSLAAMAKGAESEKLTRKSWNNLKEGLEKAKEAIGKLGADELAALIIKVETQLDMANDGLDVREEETRKQEDAQDQVIVKITELYYKWRLADKAKKKNLASELNDEIEGLRQLGRERLADRFKKRISPKS